MKWRIAFPNRESCRVLESRRVTGKICDFTFAKNEVNAGYSKRENNTLQRVCTTQIAWRRVNRKTKPRRTQERPFPTLSIIQTFCPDGGKNGPQTVPNIHTHTTLNVYLHTSSSALTSLSPCAGLILLVGVAPSGVEAPRRAEARPSGVNGFPLNETAYLAFGGIGADSACRFLSSISLAMAAGMRKVVRSRYSLSSSCRAFSFFKYAGSL